jgi:hypothetical protein
MDIGSHEKTDIVTCDTISGHFVTDIGENADIRVGGGNNPDAVIYLYRHIMSYDAIYFSEKYIPVYTRYHDRNSGKVYTLIYPVYVGPHMMAGHGIWGHIPSICGYTTVYVRLSGFQM